MLFLRVTTDIYGDYTSLRKHQDQSGDTSPGSVPDTLSLGHRTSPSDLM